MKNRIIRVLLLLSATALVYIPCVASDGRQDDIEQTDVAAQEEISTEIILENFFQAWTTNVVNVRKNPSETENIIKVYTECEQLLCTEYDNEWVKVIIKTENSFINGYVKTEYITRNKIENEYRKLMLEQTNIQDKKEWFLRYKDFCKNNDYNAQKTIYDCFTEQELDLLFRVVQAEIGNYSFEQKVNVANVILNRVDHERFGESLSEVLIPSQFSTISNGRINKVKVSEDTILACEYAFLFADTTNGALFFDSDGTLNYPKIGEDGAHNFYCLKEEIYYEE